MSLSHQTYPNLTTASVAASGSVSLTQLTDYRRYKIVCKCTAALTWTLSAGVVATRLATIGTAAATSYVVQGDDGPWPFATIAWSGNAGGAAVYIDMVVDDSRQVA